MDKWQGKTAVVTGASGGIGASIAVALADAGMRVVAVARRLENVQALQKQVNGKGELVARRCDVSRDSDVEELFAYVTKSFGGVDLLVNNAALLTEGTIVDCSGNAAPMSDIDSVLNVNVRGVIVCTRLAVQSMRERRVGGHIIYINSIAGHGIPNNGSLMAFNVYPVSKYAVTALAELTRLEFSYNDLPIRTTSISPGAVDTPMLDTVKELLSPQDARVPMLQPEDIAAAVLYAVSAPLHVNVQEITIHPTGERF